MPGGRSEPNASDFTNDITNKYTKLIEAAPATPTVVSPDTDAVDYATVLHDYEPFRCDEIHLRAGERVKVLSNDCRHSGGEGWWVGVESETGRIGVFPSAYVAVPHRTFLSAGDTPKQHDELQSHARSFTSNSSSSTSSSDRSVDRPDQSNPTVRTEPIAIVPSEEHTFPDTDDQSEQARVVLRNGSNRKAAFQVKTIPSSEIIQQQFIGSGAFGTVYRGLWGDRDVALKVLNLPTAQVDKEASHLCRLSHKNVVQFFGVCELASHNFPALVMEFAYGGPLNAVLMQHPVLGPSTLLDWAIQIATGMAYLHTDARLVHRDLKSANILIREPITSPYREDELRRCTLVITDFGMACRSSELVPQQSKLGTVAYAAPEVCRQAGFSFKSDVWSYAVVLWELLTLEVPFRMMEQPRLMYIIAMYNYTLFIPDDVPELFSKLLRDCWSPDPDNRPSFEDIIARLQLTSFCNFLSMDSEELSHIQAGWRESILAHHRVEQESAAATLSSSMTRSQLAVMEEDLVAQMERLRRERESLDRERQQLAERAHQIDLMEESYNRMVGTMGQQFMLLAVLAANQLKEMPCQTHPKPPPPRKRPFMLGLFRRWGSTGEPTAHKTASLTSAATGKDRKASAYSQRTWARNNSHASLARSSESLAINTSRLGCSRGGIPLISPPVNMKHVVHVDHEWIAGCGLSDSSMNLFPAAMADSFPDGQPDVLNASLRSTSRARFQIVSTDCFPTQRTSPCAWAPPSNSDTSAHLDPPVSMQSSARPSQAQTGPARPANLWDSVDPHQFAAWYQPIDSDTRMSLPKGDRGVPRLLRKNARTTQQPGTFTESADVFITTSSVSVGSSNFFTPVVPEDSSVTDTGSHEPGQAFRRPVQSSPRLLLSSASGDFFNRLTGEDGERDSNSTCSSPSDGRHFSSGRTMPNLPLWTSVDPTARCGCNSCSNSNVQMVHSPPPCAENDPQSAYDLLRLLCSVYPPHNWPSLGLPATGCPHSQVASTPDVRKPVSGSTSDEARSVPCVEHALWSAFQLAASFSCLTVSQIDGGASLLLNELVSADSNCTATTCPLHRRPRSDESCTSETTAVGGASRSRFGRTKDIKRCKAKSKGGRTPNGHIPGCTTGVPVTDSRRRFQSADRWGRSQASFTSVCSSCRGMAALPELIGECIARQAEFGDPHSPFLGMLAGSGRRPTASANQPGRGGQRMFPPRPTIQCSDRIATLGNTQCNHSRPVDSCSPIRPCCVTDRNWARASFDVLPHSSGMTNAIRPHFDCSHAVPSQNKSMSNLPDSSRRPDVALLRCQQDLGDVSLAVASAASKLGQSCELNPSFADQSELEPRDSPGGLMTFGRPRLRSAEQPITSSSNCRTSTDFASDPALALTSYNPVAVSRDAYLKATKDGYLNRTAESPGEVTDERVPNTRSVDSLPGSSLSFSNPGFYANSGGSIATLNPAEVEQYLWQVARCAPGDKKVGICRKEHVNDRQHSSDSDDEADDSGVYQIASHRQPHEEEGDGVTLVPADCWEPHFAEDEDVMAPAVPPRSVQRQQLKRFSPASPSTSAVPVPMAGSPRRLIQRSPAMRELQRPDFLGMVRNHSVPETHAPTWSRQIDTSNSLPDGAGNTDGENSRTNRTGSPCGPFVSLDSAFL